MAAQLRQPEPTSGPDTAEPGPGMSKAGLRQKGHVARCPGGG